MKIVNSVVTLDSPRLKLCMFMENCKINKYIIEIQVTSTQLLPQGYLLELSAVILLGKMWTAL